MSHILFCKSCGRTLGHIYEKFQNEKSDNDNRKWFEDNNVWFLCCRKTLLTAFPDDAFIEMKKYEKLS
jgi:DNA-directed RNA polymerase subunit N (RpoN/RPB10)